MCLISWLINLIIKSNNQICYAVVRQILLAYSLGYMDVKSMSQKKSFSMLVGQLLRYYATSCFLCFESSADKGYLFFFKEFTLFKVGKVSNELELLSE